MDKFNNWSKVISGAALLLAPPLFAATDQCVANPDQIACKPGSPEPQHGNEGGSPDGPFQPMPTVMGTGTGTDTGSLPPQPRPPWFGQQDTSAEWVVQETIKHRQKFMAAILSQPATSIPS